MAGTVRHVNVPYPHPMAQQSVNQVTQQTGVRNEMVLYQQPSAQVTQHAPHKTSVTQPIAPASPQPASATLPMVPPPPQPAQVAG
jgi:hypothetical protein